MHTRPRSLLSQAPHFEARCLHNCNTQIAHGWWVHDGACGVPASPTAAPLHQLVGRRTQHNRRTKCRCSSCAVPCAWCCLCRMRGWPAAVCTASSGCQARQTSPNLQLQLIDVSGSCGHCRCGSTEHASVVAARWHGGKVMEQYLNSKLHRLTSAEHCLPPRQSCKASERVKNNQPIPSWLPSFVFTMRPLCIAKLSTNQGLVCSCNLRLAAEFTQNLHQLIFKAGTSTANGHGGLSGDSVHGRLTCGRAFSCNAPSWLHRRVVFSRDAGRPR
jgi:hypothetical protein